MWKNGDNPLSIWYDALCSDIPDLESAVIQVEKMNGSVLLISGAEDANFNSVSFNQTAVDRLKRFNHPSPYEHLVYPGAGHQVGFPNIPIMANHFTGGSKKETAKASRESWMKTIEFFKDSFKNRG